MLGQAAGAGVVVLGWGVEVEDLVGAVVVVVVAVGVEAGLGLGVVAPVIAGEQFVVEGSVEAFVLALCLRVTGASVEDLDAQSQEPDGEGGVSGVGGCPWVSVVAEDLFGDAVDLECGLECRLHLGCVFRGADVKGNEVSGVVVDDG